MADRTVRLYVAAPITVIDNFDLPTETLLEDPISPL
ncbi:hypothetical protein J3D49_000498 [Pseudomonas kilonensis]|nr:hypothetical protein [Pseudomonas kilonensis]